VGPPIYDDWIHHNNNEEIDDWDKVSSTLYSNGAQQHSYYQADTLVSYEEDQGQAYAALPHGVAFDHKTPPAFDGHSSFYTYEEMVWEWIDITCLPKEKLGPALRARLRGEAAVHKTALIAIY